MEQNPDGIDMQDFDRWSLSRRQLLRSTAVAGAAIGGAGLLAACGSSAKSSSGGKSSGSKSTTKSKLPTAPSLVSTPRKETVIIDQGVFTVYDSFNPLIPNGDSYQGGMVQCTEEFLWYLNMATGKLLAWQGDSWAYNTAFTQCTLKIKPNVTWNDGKPMTSADIVFTINYMKANEASVTVTPFWSEITSMTAPDTHTVVFNLNKVDPRFHYNFIAQIISANLLILPEHIWSGKDVTTFKNDPPVFTGPYTLKSTSANEGQFVWEKSPNYWNKATMDPQPKYVVFRNTPTDADLDNEQFKDGQTDYCGSSSAETYAATLQKQGNENIVICNFVDSDQRSIIVNCDPSRGALSDPKFRYAISMLMDREKIVKNIWPVPTVVDVYPWPTYPNTKSWDNASIAAKFAQYREYNPTKAGQLLDELGIKKGSGGKRYYQGKPVTQNIITPSSSAGAQAQEYIIGQLLVAELEALGIASSIKQPSSAVYSELVDKGNFDIRSEWYGLAILDQWQLYTSFDSSLYYEPIGTNSLSNDQMRLKEKAFDDTIAKLALLSPTASSSTPTYNEALDQFFTYLPIIDTIQTVYSHVSSTYYWTGWPTDDNLYQIPSNWWGQFMFVIGNLKPSGLS